MAVVERFVLLSPSLAAEKPCGEICPRSLTDWLVGEKEREGKRGGSPIFRLVAALTHWIILVGFIKRNMRRCYPACSILPTIIITITIAIITLLRPENPHGHVQNHILYYRTKWRVRIIATEALVRPLVDPPETAHVIPINTIYTNEFAASRQITWGFLFIEYHTTRTFYSICHYAYKMQCTTVYCVHTSPSVTPTC